jgi:hypothetical protein
MGCNSRRGLAEPAFFAAPRTPAPAITNLYGVALRNLTIKPTYQIDRLMDGIGSLGQWPHQPPKERQLMQVIRSLMAEGRIVILDHAQDRLYERDLDMGDVINVVKTGTIRGKIRPGDNPLEWICKVVCQPRYPDNRREVGVVVIVVSTTGLLLQTVEWEDI